MADGAARFNVDANCGNRYIEWLSTIILFSLDRLVHLQKILQSNQITEHVIYHICHKSSPMC